MARAMARANVFFDFLVITETHNCMPLLNCQEISAVLRRCIHFEYHAPSCTVHNLPTTNVRDDFQLFHTIVSLGLPIIVRGKRYKERSRALTTHLAAVVLNGFCSEAVALIGEVVAVRWYFLRDEAHVLYPMADVCGKGQKTCFVGNSRHVCSAKCR